MALFDLVVRAAVLAAVSPLSYLVFTYLRSPLKAIPGPFWAKFTDLWRVYSWWTGHAHLNQIELHRKLGTAVRMGPNFVSLSDPNMIKTVYSTKSPWKKSNMYSSNDVVVNGELVSNIFATTDNKWHSKMVKPIRAIMSVSKVTSFEPGVDETIKLFCHEMEARFVKDESLGLTIAMEKWILWYAYEGLYKMTFGVHRGYLEKGEDVNNFIKDSMAGIIYFGICSQMPLLDKVYKFISNNITTPGPPPFLWAFQQAYAAVAERNAQREAGINADRAPDLLDQFIDAKKTYPDIVDDDHKVVNYLFLNIVAGSDTTGTSLSAIVYYTLRNQQAYARLRKELDAAGLDPTVPVSWRDCQSLIYLDAVIQEGLRIHPPIGLHLERVVPRGGSTLLDGRFLPEGTKVGMNAWVTNRSEELFGPDTDSFVPERWLRKEGEPEDEFKARYARMKGLDFTFGYGSRICTGKSAAYLEMYKLIATIFLLYDFELMVEKEWKTTNFWFVLLESLPIRLKRRTKARW